MLPWGCLGAFSESSLEPPWDMTKVPHTTSTSSLSPDCLHTPIVLPRASSRETTGRTAALLKVKAAAATPHTERVGLVPPLTKTPRSLPLQQQSISFHITLFDPPLKLVEKLREREVTIFRRRRKP